MTATNKAEYIETIVIGGGQAGLSTGYHLKRRGLPFLILDACERIGDQWRMRWDSLRLFTPARYAGLDGMPYDAPPWNFPTKDEFADYLQAYVDRFDLPVLSGVRVERLSREADRFVLECGEQRFEADHVIVAMGHYQAAKVPSFASELPSDIVQLHSTAYQNPAQLRPGGVLIVGAGNSGAEIAKELAPLHDVWLSGRDVGQVPFQIDGFAGRHGLVKLTLRGLFHRVFTVGTPIGRKMRPKVLTQGGPLIRTKQAHLRAAGVRHVTRVTGVEDGVPVLEDGQRLDVSNVIWCTGYDSNLGWIDLPVHGEHEPLHEAGVVPSCPGLYFVGLAFQYSLSSAMIHAVGRDADRIVGHVAAAVEARAGGTQPAPAREVAAGR